MGTRRTKKGYAILDGFDGLAYRKRLEFENRKAWWRGRLATKLSKDLCAHCYTQKICRRLKVNGIIIDGILSGDTCPDYNGVWTSIFSRRVR